VSFLAKNTLILLSMVFTGVMSSCTGEYWDYYEPSDPEQIRIFLREQNILRGSPEETTLALVDWSRHNLIHGEVDGPRRSILDAINQGRSQGYIEIGGCWGTASFFRQVLAAVNIQVKPESIVLGGRLHARVDFPALGRTALHADNLHIHVTSSRQAEVPADAILAPLSLVTESRNDNEAARAYQDGIIRRYLPDSMTRVRAMFTYRRYYSAEEVNSDLSGRMNSDINDVSTNSELLRLVDDEIDRLGGVARALTALNGWLDSPANHSRLVPVPADKIYRLER
jgi:hypothetical protein